MAPPGFFGAEEEPETKPASTSDRYAFGPILEPQHDRRQEARAIDAVMEEMMINNSDGKKRDARDASWPRTRDQIRTQRAGDQRQDYQERLRR